MPLIAFLFLSVPLDPIGADLSRFPSTDEAIEATRLNGQYLLWLADQLALYPHRRDWFVLARDEALNCRACWETLRALRLRYTSGDFGLAGGTLPCHTESQRKEAMNRLRWYLGEECFLTGRMPPPVPVWRMRSK